MATASITVNMDRKCAECGKPGAAASGICLACAAKVVTGARMRSPQGEAAQKRYEAGKGDAAGSSEESGAAEVQPGGGDLDVTVRRTSLLEAVKLALAVVPRRATIPALSLVRLQVDAVGRLLIQATDLEQTLTVSLERCKDTADVGGECLVSPRTLAVVLSSGPDEVRLQRRPGFDSDRLYVGGLGYAGGNGWLALVDASEWPREAEPGKDAAFAHVEAQVLRRALGLVAAARSVDESRNIITGTHLEIRAGEVVAMATDGRRAARAAVTTETGRSGASGVVFPPRTGDLLLKVAEGELVLTIWPEGIRVESQDADSGRTVRLTAKTFAGLYPDVDRVFPLREAATRVRRVQADALHEAAALVVDLARCSGEELHADLVLRSASPETLLVEAQGGAQGEWFREVSAAAVPLPMGRSDAGMGIEERTVLNPGFLADALAPLGGVPCEVWFHGANTPVMIEATGYACAIMPMRGDTYAVVTQPAEGQEDVSDGRGDVAPADPPGAQAAAGVAADRGETADSATPPQSAEGQASTPAEDGQETAAGPQTNEEAWEAEQKKPEAKPSRKRGRKAVAA